MRFMKRPFVVSLDKVSDSLVILASQSPRRRDLLAAAGVRFQVKTAPAEELHDASMPPALLCETNAALKAGAVAADYPDFLVIGADTLVFLDDLPLGKPADLQEARETLARLSGRTHFVCTGVSLQYPGGTRTFSVRTEVVFKELSAEDIELYLSLVPVLDKAGSYACQERGDIIISEIRGDRDNVIGLPVKKLLKVMQDIDRECFELGRYKSPS